jgi:hypothetical protein
MTTRIRKAQWAVAVVAVMGLASWRLSGAREAPQTRTGAPVHTVATGQRTADDPGKRGATYYALEGQTTRFISDFVDGTRAIAERGVDGDVQTRLDGADGNEINHLRVDRRDGNNDVVQYGVPKGDSVQALIDTGVRPTLDWANRQSHRFYQDRVASAAGLEWRDGLMRRAGENTKDDADQQVRTVETQWANGLSARTARVHAARGQTFDGLAVNGDILVTQVRRDGVEIGVTNYLTYERIYAWSLPGLTEGRVANEHLKPRHGGWPFTPDMVWMNLQALGLYHWKTMINERGFVARQSAPRNPILQFFAPVASADAGCDGLHWLDGTVLRYCCDVHDRCYEKYGCSASSWWQVWSSWRCDVCNIGAVFCFTGGPGGGGPFTRYIY